MPQVDKSWNIYCVRGPLTAQAMGLGRDTAITDPAILVKRMCPAAEKKNYRVSYMPHHASDKQAHHFWQSLCSDLGMHYIDPHLPVETVLSEIGQTALLVTEALHGAIVADTLRVPWIPVVSSPHILRFKWDDWCQSVEVEYRPQEIPAPSPTGESDRERHDTAANALDAIARNTTACLSQDHVLEQRIMALDTRLDQLRRDFKGKSGAHHPVNSIADTPVLRTLKEAERRKQIITQRQTDVARWSDPDQLEEFWAKRAEAAASMIAPGSTVLDLGCGAMDLEKLLPQGCRYIPCDVVMRDERTLICDFNNGAFPPGNEATVITVLGVLEYIYEPERFIKTLSAYKLPVIMSYNPTDSGLYPDRGGLGWVNHLSWEQLATACQQVGFQLYNLVRIDSSQVLLHMGCSPL